MRLPAIIPVSMVVYLGFSSASAMYIIPEIKKVPMDRLFTNLQLRLARNTNDFSVTYDLARLHSMSYATNLAEVDVRRDDKRPYFDYPGSDSGVPLRNSPSARDPQTVKRPEGRAPTPLLRGALNTYPMGEGRGEGAFARKSEVVFARVLTGYSHGSCSCPIVEKQPRSSFVPAGLEEVAIAAGSQIPDAAG